MQQIRDQHDKLNVVLQHLYESRHTRDDIWVDKDPRVNFIELVNVINPSLRVMYVILKKKCPKTLPKELHNESNPHYQFPPLLETKEPMVSSATRNGLCRLDTFKFYSCIKK